MAKNQTGVVLLGLGVVAAGVALLAKGSAAAQVPSQPGQSGPLPPGTPGGQQIAKETPSQQMTCQLDANIPPILRQQIVAALNTAGVPSSTYAQLAQLAQANNFPMAAACLSQAAANPASAKSLGQQVAVGAGSSVLSGIFAQHPPTLQSGVLQALGQTSPVDWSQTDWTKVNQIAGLVQQGLSLAQANQVVSLTSQGTPLAQAIAQVQQQASSGLSSWQLQAQNALVLAGWSGSSAASTAAQLSDPQARYFTRLTKHGFSANDALIAAQNGASDLAKEAQIESMLSPSQLKALNFLVVNAWEADNITTPRVSADRPPPPAQERIITQLAANLTGQKADFFNQLVSTGSGVREAYTQMTGDSNFPKG